MNLMAGKSILIECSYRIWGCDEHPFVIMSSTKGLQESKKEKRERKKEKKEKVKNLDKNSELVENHDGLESESIKDPAEESREDESLDNAKTEKSKKRFNDEDAEDKGDELEIDLNLSAPLSKKKQRQLKKGKLDLEKIAKKNPPPKPATEDGEPTSAPGKSPFGVWIGNLSYDTSKEDIIKFIIARTQNNEAETSDVVTVEEKDISRVNLPKKGDKIKGFAYVDLPSLKHVDAVVALSESRLNNRNLLIKNASSFEGRPEEHKDQNLLKNPPSRILFVGNLPFDATDDLLDEHFRPYGEIVRIRMATFEDTGKCKGFAFLDFKDETGPTAALKSKLAKTFINRKLRLEFGEDRSKRNPKRFNSESLTSDASNEGAAFKEIPEIETTLPQRLAQRERAHNTKRQREHFNDASNKRMKSSVALATAQRASAAIVPSQGKKVTFD